MQCVKRVLVCVVHYDICDISLIDHVRGRSFKRSTKLGRSENPPRGMTNSKRYLRPSLTLPPPSLNFSEHPLMMLV